MQNETNILLTSVGRRSYLVNYFKEALCGNGEVHVANSTELCPAFNVADHSVVTPLIYDKQYIPFLLKYCKQNNIKAIISLFDVDLPVLSENKNRFLEIGTFVIVADKWVIDICNDKWKSYKFLVENQFNVPKTYLTVERVLEKIKEGQIQYPVIIKPRWGMGSISVYEANNEEELIVLYRKTKKNILDSYLKYESKINIKESILIQEKLIGKEYGLDIINNLEGQYQTTIVKEKYAMRAGETDCAMVVQNIKLKELGKRLGKCFCHIGNMDVDVFVKDDRVYILEMNARFGGGYPFSHQAGVNLPLAIIKWLNKEENADLLLKEEANVLVHKDIVLTRLHVNKEV